VELLNWNYLQRKILQDLGVGSLEVDKVIKVAQVLRPYKCYDMNLETRNLCMKEARRVLGYE